MAFENTDRVIQDEKRKLLEAVATAGSAGRAAYEAAKQGIAQQDAASSARALQAAALNGVDPAALAAPGSVRAAAEQALATRRMNLEQAQATHAADLSRRQAASEAYLTGVAGAVPVMQARADEAYLSKKGDLERDLATRQSDLDRALALAQQRYEQAQKDAEEDRAFKREQRQWARETQAAKAAKAAKGPEVSLNALLGLANQTKTAATPRGPVDFGPGIQPGESMQAYLARLETAAQGRREQNRIVETPLTDLAAQIGRTIGVPETKIAELYSPAQQSTLAKQTGPAPSKDETAKALAAKYDTKGVTYDLAKSVLGNKDFNDDVQDILAGAGGKTRSEVEALLRKHYLVDRYWPSEYHILVGEYLPLLPE